MRTRRAIALGLMALAVFALLRAQVFAQWPSTAAIEALKTMFSGPAGTYTFTGPLLLPDGTVNNPSWGWTSDNDGTGTGMFRNLANRIGVTINGVSTVQFLSSGFTPSATFTSDLGLTGVGWREVFSGRYRATGTAPTTSSTGTGTGPTNTVDTGSADIAGTITVTAGTTPAANGTLTVTFSAATAYGVNAPACVMILGNGTGTWNARATVIGGAYSTTSAVFNWDNNAVALTATSTYKFHYYCAGK